MWSLVIYGMLVFASASSPGVPSNQINEKALRHFEKSNKEVLDERWIIGEDCYRVSFKKGSVKHIVDYNLNGKWRNTIRVYNESDLENDLRRSIKTAFPESEILMINELNYGNKLVYFIKIRHEEWSKTIQLTDDNIEVVEEFREK